MNDAQIDRRRNTRGNKVHKVAPVARAIRAALAASATMLALSGTAFAQGACDDTATHTLQSCAGDLAAVHADASLFINPVDLTVVVDDQPSLRTVGARALGRYAAIDAGSIATFGASNGIVIGSYAGGVPYVDVTTLENFDVVSAAENIIGYDATAIGALVNGGEGIALLINGGDITASASSDIGTAYAVGAAVYGVVATAINDTTIVAGALSDTGEARAIGMTAYGLNTGAYNYGDITASASATGTGGIAGAMGLYSIGLLSAVSDNQGDISVVSNGNVRATAVGIYNLADVYDSVVHNSGSIGAHAITNGDASFAAAAAVQATSLRSYGMVEVQNAGDLVSTAEAHGNNSIGVAYGVLAIGGGADILVQNDGSVAANASVEGGVDNSLVNAFGIYADSYGGKVSIMNNGDMVATGHGADYGSAYVFGVYAFAGAPNANAIVDIGNTGHIGAHATVLEGGAYAIGTSGLAAFSTTTNAAGGTIEATADTPYAGVAGATGIANNGLSEGKVVNDGSVSAYAHSAGTGEYSRVYASAMGIYSAANPGNGKASIVNHGDVSASAVVEDAPRMFAGSSGVTGLLAYGRFADLQTDGDVDVNARSNAGRASAYAVVGHGKYATNLVTGGDITAYAYAGTVANDPQGYGGRAFAFGTKIYGTSIATQTNSADISATAIAADPFAMAKPSISYAEGINVQSKRTATLDNSGDVSVYARADAGFANAYGIFMLSRRVGAISNSGDITVGAHADGDGGIALAMGVYDFSRETATVGVSSFVNSGDIDVLAQADGAVALSYGAMLVGQERVDVDNSGRITAAAAGAAAKAQGLVANTLAGGTTVYNTGTFGAAATSTAGDARADGAVAFGTTVTTLVTDGIVYADATATGGNATAYGAYVKGGMNGGIGLLINGGDIDATATADGGLAYAVGEVVYADVATVINDQHVGAAAHAINGDAIAFGMQAYSFNAGMYNYGDLVATAVSDNGNAGALGIKSYGYFSSIAYNAGDIAVGVQSTADATGTGVYSLGIMSGAYATNTGTITVEVTGEEAVANGVLNAVLYVGNATVTNDNAITVTAHGFSNAQAVGAYNFAYLYDATLANHGDIVASARAEGHPEAEQRVDVIGARSVNVYGQGWGDSTLVNDGTIASLGWVEYGTGTAWASVVEAGPYATADLENNGTLYASMHAEKGLAGSYGALVQTYGKANVVNHGDIFALTSISNSEYVPFIQYGDATGIKAVGYAYGADVSNDGTVHAQAVAGGGIVTAMGVFGNGKVGSVSNAGEITAIAQTTGWGGAFAYGVNLHGTYDASVVNDGTINAYGIAHDDESGHYGASRVTGIYAAANVQGNVSVVNNGDIHAISSAENVQGFFTGGANAKGIDAYGKYDVIVENNADIQAVATSDGGMTASYGAIVESKYFGHMVNAADAVITSIASTATIADDYAGGRAYAVGVALASTDLALVENDGTIITHATVDPGTGLAAGRLAVATAWGVHNLNAAVSADVVNHGDIEAVAVADFGYASAYGTFLKSTKAVSVQNSGSIVAAAQANGGDAWAVGSYSFAYHRKFDGCDANGCHYTPDGGYATVDNLGDIVAQASSEDGVATAYGAVAISVLGSGATNAGHITSIAQGNDVLATGVLVNTFAASSTVQNSGAIAVSGTGTTVVEATGAELLGTSVQFDNTGSVGVGAYGPMASATGASMEADGGDSVLANAGDLTAVAEGHDVYATGVLSTGFLYGVTVQNDGDIVASAKGTTTATATAAQLTGTGGAIVDNTGSLVAGAHATSTATAIALWTDAASANALTNAGDIAASAKGDDVIATGVLSNSFATLTNDGVIAADAHGKATADAVAASLTGAAGLTASNSGSIVATAQGDLATATALWSDAASANTLANAGTIAASAKGIDAHATGVLANSFATLDNDGDIVVDAQGKTAAQAVAAHLAGVDGVTVDNSGSIVASAKGKSGSTATALWLDAPGANVVDNSGTIAAYGDGERVAIASFDATTTITNTGTIIGAIQTGDLADSFDTAAGGTWLAIGDSGFGGGDDIVTNAGTLVLQDSTIDLGGYATGNAFSNTGSLFASGHNAINSAFSARNDGTISFLDGAPDDMLTIDGDFAGQGTIRLDVSGMHNTSDVLYVTGDVADASTQSLDVDVLDLPTAAFVKLPMIYVDGESEAKQFVLGNVTHNQRDFTTLEVTLDAEINAANASKDLFFLGVSVTGLNDQGAIATALTPGVARLIDAQIGTWRQRMGVVQVQGSQHGLAPWIRGFADSGDINPNHVQNFGTGGNYGFSQSNDGWEVGIDSRPGDNAAFGLLLSKSDGDQRLADGSGRTHLKGTGFGLYLTLMGDQGAYVDGSVRWTGVDAQLDSGTASHKTEGSAETINIEAGLNPWTVGRVGIQPQLQYTVTDVADFQMLDGDSAGFIQEGGRSVRGRLGVAFSTTMENGGFLLTPYGSVNAVHEFDGEYTYSINNRTLFGATQLDGTSAMVELGLGARKDAWTVSGGFNWTDGGALEGLFGGQVIVRYSW